jgi:uncharacterized membrane protein YfcA
VLPLLGIGIVAGFFSALFGVGGGIVVVPLLLIVARFDLRPATATSLAGIGLTAAAGTVIYAVHGLVEPSKAALLGVPAAFGAVAGTWLQQRVPAEATTLLFAALLVGVAIRLVLTA